MTYMKCKDCDRLMTCVYNIILFASADMRTNGYLDFEKSGCYVDEEGMVHVRLICRGTFPKPLD